MSQVNTISDLMAQIGEDRKAVINSSLTDAQARNALRADALQVKVAEIVLQAARITRKNGAALQLTTSAIDVEQPTGAAELG